MGVETRRQSQHGSGDVEYAVGDTSLLEHAEYPTTREIARTNDSSSCKPYCHNECAPGPVNESNGNAINNGASPGSIVIGGSHTFTCPSITSTSIA